MPPGRMLLRYTDLYRRPVSRRGKLDHRRTRDEFWQRSCRFEGLVLSQGELDGLNSLISLTLTSYSTFDLCMGM